MVLNSRELFVRLAGTYLFFFALVESATTARAEMTKQFLGVEEGGFGANRLHPYFWVPLPDGFEWEGSKTITCDNGEDATARRGATQSVRLNQQQPMPIYAEVKSLSDQVSGSDHSFNYSLYLDLIFTDGTPLWGQKIAFSTGTHDWQTKKVMVLPEKPISQVIYSLILRSKSGKASFTEPLLYQIEPTQNSHIFDGFNYVQLAPPVEGFQIRDVGNESGFQTLSDGVMGLQFDVAEETISGRTYYDATLRSGSGEDQILTLIYSIPVEGDDIQWLHDPDTSFSSQEKPFFGQSTFFAVGSNGNISRYPLAAVSNETDGFGLGIDLVHPAIFRGGYSPATKELFLAWDIALTAEKPDAHVRFCKFNFGPEWGFRGALQEYYDAFPGFAPSRIEKQGQLMPFSPISEVEGFEDFGFRYKEGIGETEWDDANDILTFHYQAPFSWGMHMEQSLPQTYLYALAQLQVAMGDGNEKALAVDTSGARDSVGRYGFGFVDKPWLYGASWDLNPSPAIPGDITAYTIQWNADKIFELYGPQAIGDLDGEHIDSTESESHRVNFRREHFEASSIPISYDLSESRPVIFYGLSAYEYIKSLASDLRAINKYLSIADTPIQLPWFCRWGDVLGQEADWNPGGNWIPMDTSELLYRRAMSGDKTYFLVMNTNLDNFTYDRMELYMKRSLAYGIFPGMFSENAFDNRYFENPDLYNRDRPLFQKYMPLVTFLAEAGWEPITGARSDNPIVKVERFGEDHLTLFNSSREAATARVTLDGFEAENGYDLVGNQPISIDQGRIMVSIEGDDVILLEKRPAEISDYPTSIQMW